MDKWIDRSYSQKHVWYFPTFLFEVWTTAVVSSKLVTFGTAQHAPTSLLTSMAYVTPLMTPTTDLGLSQMRSRERNAARAYCWIFTPSYIPDGRGQRLVCWPMGVRAERIPKICRCNPPQHPGDTHYRISIKTLLSRTKKVVGKYLFLRFSESRSLQWEPR